MKSALLAALLALSCASPDTKTPMITLSDIRAHGVIGALGQPLGEVLRVEAVVVDGDSLRTKATSGLTLLRVERVEGAPLEDAPLLHHRGLDGDLEPGARLELIVYETGGFSGTPEAAFEHIPAHATTGFHFTTELIVLRSLTP